MGPTASSVAAQPEGFFSHRQALGLKIDEDLSPELVERLTYLGAKLPSFRDAHEALDVLLRTKLSEKRVERQTERIGDERVAQRAQEIAAWSERTLLEKQTAPAGVKAPPAAAVLADGGRLQLREPHAGKTSRWHEYKAEVIAELAERQRELGPASPDDGETSPRTLVTQTLTYLQNQQSRMNYPEYRRQGLPITSAHRESTAKLINRRVKGSEKSWTERGAEALLQLTADLLSTSQPLTAFWHTRPHRQPGYRTYAKHAAEHPSEMTKGVVHSSTS